MKNAMKKLMSLVLAAILLVSAVPFAASAAVGDPITFAIYQKVDGVDDIKTGTVTATADRITIAEVCSQLGIAAGEFEGCWINGNKKNYGDDMPGDAASITEAKIRKVAKVTAPVTLTCTECGATYAEGTAHTCPVPVSPIEIVVKVDSNDNVVWTGTKVPSNGQYALVGNLLTHGWNKAWSDSYTFDHAYAYRNDGTKGTVGQDAQINAGETVHILVTTKCTNHKYDNGVVTQAATTTSTGIKTYTCTVCGATKEEVLPKTGTTIIPENKPMIILDLNYQGAQKYYIELDSTYITWANVLPLIENQYGTFKRDNFIFAGWYWDNDFDYKCKNDELVSTKVVDQVTVYAKWTVPQDTPKTLLYLHTDTGIKDDPYDVTGYTTTDGKIDIYEVLKYVRKLYSFKSYSGLYTDESWTSQSYVTTESVDVKGNELTIIHLNITGAKPLGSNGTTSSSSSATADSSNPKTGDMIFAPIFVLGLSASALAVIFYLNKKRAF